ncbi:MAG TPA: hypothetical protein PL193_07060 [Xanthobacteraceae bacterium]|nr:hypothetical protein [Xanthobacteraceae bacterium]
MTFAPSNFLRRVLQLDAVATGATGLLLLGGMSFLPALLNLPSALLTYAGIFCVGWALTLGFASFREQIGSSFVWTIIVANIGWVIASTALLLSGYVSPTWLGYAFVIAQALAVDIFAGLQIYAMWKYEKRTNVTA